MTQTSLPDPDPTEVDELVRRIEACQIPRRKPRAEPSLRAQLSADDPLRHQITGASGAYLIRRLLHTLGFDEHRAMQWRMEHKLVQASVFERYVPGALPRSWGLGALIRALGPQAIRGALAAALPGGAFIKRSLGCCSGDRGQEDSTEKVLESLKQGANLVPSGPSLSNEVFMVQERLPIDREIRVHSMEDSVLPGFTSLRYDPGYVPADSLEAEAYVQSILDRLPDALVGEAFWSWDVAVNPGQGPRVVEVNFSGFHPVYYRGFQCSGFFQGHAVGPELCARLLEYVADSYGVEVDIPTDHPGDMVNDVGYLAVVRHRHAARLRKASSPALSTELEAPAESRIDAMLCLNERGVEQFAILQASMEAFLDPLGTCWIITPDDLRETLVVRFERPRFKVLGESDVLPELKELGAASTLSRTQAVKLALVTRRVETNFVIDLTPDAICTRPVVMDDLVKDGRSRFYRFVGQLTHADHYQTAKRLLGSERSGYVYADTAGVFNRTAMRELVDHLESRAGGTSWPALLLVEESWSLRSLYFTFLEAADRDDLYHRPSSSQFFGYPVWEASQWPSWRADLAFAPDDEHVFTIVRTDHQVSAGDIRAKIRSYIALDNGGDR